MMMNDPVSPWSVAPPKVRRTQVLYLDFDGVLHPEDVWQLPGGPPYVRSPLGHSVFEHADLLSRLLSPYPDVRIVLSTTWARRMSYGVACEHLPASLQKRCIGATWHSEMSLYDFERMERGEQVRADVKRRAPTEWLALDDDVEGWAGAFQTNLVSTHPVEGISEPMVLEQLRRALERFSD
jgi:hypothetical protein